MLSVPVHAFASGAVTTVDRPDISLAQAVKRVYQAWVQGNRLRRLQAEKTATQDPDYAIMRGM